MRKPIHKQKLLMLEHWPYTDQGKVTVVIPVLNESETIVDVVQFARRSPLTGEVIVVDDGSIDGTPELAAQAGARVITSSMLGKGVSMDDGLRAASNETILYLDGDLQGLADDLVERMTLPIIEGRADLVKAKFSRSAGRVTMLTAKPLLKTYFPELVVFDQPLSGIMAARRSLLQTLQFESDYGVDVGLLIDAALAKARLAESDVGHVEHDSHPLEVLGEMATQVARTILDRAVRCGRHRTRFMQEVRERERHKSASLSHIFQAWPKTERLALFDMDGVLVNGRFIVELARRTDREPQLSEFLDRFDMPPNERMRKIAAVFTGVPREVLEMTARDMPLMPGAIETVVGLRKHGYRVGIVTDSYQTCAEIIRRRVFADFSFAHVMRFRNGKSTGKLTVCPAMLHPEGCPDHDHCKVNVMHHLYERTGIEAAHVLAVGDGENDVCLLRAAGRSIAFRPRTENVANAANCAVHGDIGEVLAAATCE